MADNDDDPDENDEGDDEEESEGGEGKSTSVGGKKKLIIIIAGTLLLVAIVIAGLYLSGFFDSELVINESSVEETSDEEQILKKTSIEETNVVENGEARNPIIEKGLFYHKFEDMNVNLVSSMKKQNFLRMSLTVAVTQETDILVMETLSPRVIDNVIQYLSGLKPKELVGSANFHKLHDNILLRVRTAVAPVLVTDALITLALVK